VSSCVRFHRGRAYAIHTVFQLDDSFDAKGRQTIYLRTGFASVTPLG
jgi:hypothetical protein